MSENPSAAQFPTTHWSRVAAAGDRATPEDLEALAELCRAYWYPLYAFIRRRGHDPDDATLDDPSPEAIEDEIRALFDALGP